MLCFFLDYLERKKLFKRRLSKNLKINRKVSFLFSNGNLVVKCISREKLRNETERKKIITLIIIPAAMSQEAETIIKVDHSAWKFAAGEIVGLLHKTRDGGAICKYLNSVFMTIFLYRNHENANDSQPFVLTRYCRTRSANKGLYKRSWELQSSESEVSYLTEKWTFTFLRYFYYSEFIIDWLLLLFKVQSTNCWTEICK